MSQLPNESGTNVNTTAQIDPRTLRAWHTLAKLRTRLVPVRTLRGMAYTIGSHTLTLTSAAGATIPLTDTRSN